MDKQTATTTDPAGGKSAPTKAGKRGYLKQSDVPEFTLEEALRIPQVIYDQFGGGPTGPADVALALDMLPTGRQFRGLSGAAVAYGLTEGGAQAPAISMTPLAKSIVAPTAEGEDLQATREAFLKPRVTREFLEKYDTKPLPSDTRIARNVLESLAVPRDRTEETLELITATAERLGLLSRVREKTVVNLRPSSHGLRVVPSPVEEDVRDQEEVEPDDDSSAAAFGGGGDNPPQEPSITPEPERNRRVFVSHGSNRKIVEQLKSMLEYGEFEPVISVERETTSKPVPEKVLDDMRSCKYGIIHVGVEKVITDAHGKEHPQLNSNVLIEIGGAMALYPEGFILLVEEGATLPSNLQGLYEVRYQGTSLDADATMRLLRAFQQFKK